VAALDRPRHVATASVNGAMCDAHGVNERPWIHGLLSRFPALRRCELAGELQITAGVAQYPACAKLDLGDPFAEVPADPQ
jgi:hypothetical protein